MESAEEAQRLEAKTDAEEARRQLLLVGLAPGMRVLDAGAGTGAVAREIAALVGPAGSVIAFDASAERLEAGRALSTLPNLGFVAGDLNSPQLPEASFDFIWCRFTFEYLADPDLVMQNLRRLLKPGGKLVVGDLDGYALFNYPAPPDVEEGLARLMSALRGRFDPRAGLKLFHRFRLAQLEEIRVHAMPHHLYAGRAPEQHMANWEARFRTMRPAGIHAFGSAEAWESFGQRFLDMLRDPDSLTYSTLFLVEGRRPLSGP